MVTQTKTSEVTLTKSEFDAALRKFLKDGNFSVPTEATVTLMVNAEGYQEAETTDPVVKVTWEL